MRALWLVVVLTFPFGFWAVQRPRTKAAPVRAPAAIPAEVTVAPLATRRKAPPVPVAAAFPTPPVARLCDAIEVTSHVEESADTSDATKEEADALPPTPARGGNDDIHRLNSALDAGAGERRDTSGVPFAAAPATKDTAASSPTDKLYREGKVQRLDLGTDSCGRQWSGEWRSASDTFNLKTIILRCNNRQMLRLDDQYSIDAPTLSVRHWPNHDFAVVSIDHCRQGIHINREEWYLLSPVGVNPTPVLSLCTWKERRDTVPYSCAFSAKVNKSDGAIPAVEVIWSAAYVPCCGHEWLEDHPLNPWERDEEGASTAGKIEDGGHVHFEWSEWERRFLAANPDDEALFRSAPGFDQDSFVCRQQDALREWSGKCRWSNNWLRLLRSGCSGVEATNFLNTLIR